MNSCTLQYGSLWPHVASEPGKCAWSELRCVVSTKHTPDIKDLVQKKCNYLMNKCYADDI